METKTLTARFSLLVIHLQSLSVPLQTSSVSQPPCTYRKCIGTVSARPGQISTPTFIFQGLQLDRTPPRPTPYWMSASTKAKRSPQPDEICDMGRRGRCVSCVPRSTEVNGKWRRKTFCSSFKRASRIRRVALCDFSLTFIAPSPPPDWLRMEAIIVVWHVVPLSTVQQRGREQGVRSKGHHFAGGEMVCRNKIRCH